MGGAAAGSILACCNMLCRSAARQWSHPGTMSWKALNSSKQRDPTSRTGSMRRDKIMGRPHSFYQAAMNYMSDNDIQQNMRYEKSHTVAPPPPPPPQWLCRKKKILHGCRPLVQPEAGPWMWT